MPFRIIRDDITKVRTDAIVNAANSSLLGGGGVDGAIHRAAGPELLKECKTLGGCRPGQAKPTKGYKLPCKYVIHTVGPIWRGGNNGEAETLRNCYRNSLNIAREKHCRSIAFPLISAGAYGYPKKEALDIAVDEIKIFLENSDMDIILVIFDQESFLIGKTMTDEIREYIDLNYVEAHNDLNTRPDMSGSFRGLVSGLFRGNSASKQKSTPAGSDNKSCYSEDEVSLSDEEAAKPEEACYQKSLKATPHPSADAVSNFTATHTDLEFNELQNIVSQIDESFSEMLLRKIDEKGMTDAQCYKRANIDRKLFSKIRSDRLYKPSKQTAIAFAIALELPLNEARDLLMKAGFAFSHSSKFDIIVEFFIQKEIYDIFQINEALFTFDQKLLA